MDIPESLDTAVERYNEGWWIRPLVGIIPSVGASLDAFLTARAARVQRERFERFAEELRNAYEQLEDEKLDKDFVRSEEFFDFFVATVERVIRAHEAANLHALRNAFVNATTTDGSSGPLKHIILRVAGDLTAAHIRLLGAVAERERRFTQADRDSNNDYVDAEQLLASAPDLSYVEVQAVATDLRNRGLLGNWWEGRWGGSGGKQDRFSLTEFGQRFVWFISEPAAVKARA